MWLCALGVLSVGQAAPPAVADDWPPTVVTHLATDHPWVALTFDACEAGERVRLDQGITAFLLAHQIPFTVFMGGRFARDNQDAVRELAKSPLVSIQNHSWSHPRDMRLLSDEAVRIEVSRAQTLLTEMTGKPPSMFRFPGGHADQRTVDLVRGMGLEVVHWRWPEGDPDPRIEAEALVSQTLERTRAGDILIFHINGRGWHTLEALPRLIEGLSARGFEWVLLDPTRF